MTSSDVQSNNWNRVSKITEEVPYIIEQLNEYNAWSISIISYIMHVDDLMYTMDDELACYTVGVSYFILNSYLWWQPSLDSMVYFASY